MDAGANKDATGAPQEVPPDACHASAAVQSAQEEPGGEPPPSLKQNMAEALSPEEQAELVRCEAIVRKGWKTFVSVGGALALIKNKRLYRASFKNWEDYCRTKWGYSKTHANRLVSAAAVVRVLAPIGVTVRAESQVRPLFGLDPDRIARAWKEAESMADGGEITARLVQKAVKTLTPTVEVPAPAKHRNESRLLASGTVREARRLIAEIQAALEVNNVAIAVQGLKALRHYFD